MPLTTPFASRHALAKRLQDHAKLSFDKLTLLPHNRFVEDSGLWWLVPSNQSPAYCDTKYYVGWDQDRLGRFEVGIYGEKGFGPKCAAFDPSTRTRGWILDEMWHWSKLLDNLASGQLLNTMQEATKATESPVYLRFNVTKYGGVAIEDRDPNAPDSDKVVYRLDPGESQLVLDREVETATGFVKRWQAEELEVADLLRELTAEDWAWIDLMVCTYFTPVEPAKAQWDAYRIWNEYLRLFAYTVSSMHI